MKKFIWVIGIISYILTAAYSPALAVVYPSFPACEAPQGETKVSYSDGTHGIVGSTATYTGSDTVYRVSDNTLAQCFCPKDGNTGVQSNWWKVNNLSQQDIDVAKNEGWNYVPNGALWGLEQNPYLVKNTEYTCKGTGGQVQSAVASVGEVLGLANTGNMVLMFGSGIVGIAFLLLGLYVFFASRK